MMRAAIRTGNVSHVSAGSATFICSRFLYGAFWLNDLEWMRFFKPCTVVSNQQIAESPGNPPEKKREAFVQTPSLQKEMKIKDVFNAVKRKEPQDLVEDLRAVDLDDLLSVLGQLRTMTRKKKNRIVLSDKYMMQLLACLQDPSMPAHIAAEAANVILNLCYEKQNVDLLLQYDGAPVLIELLASEDEELQANAAGALQSICFQPNGRHIVRALGAITLLVQLLTANSQSVRARAAGALHNISSDGEAIREIRRKGGIKSLIRLLESRQLSICGSAAGALQNISREVASRSVIRNSDAMFSLVHLLGSCELQTQVCAAGALLNLLGRESTDRGSYKKRASVVKAMRNIVVASIIQSLFFSEEAKRTFYVLTQKESQ